VVQTLSTIEATFVGTKADRGTPPSDENAASGVPLLLRAAAASASAPPPTPFDIEAVVCDETLVRQKESVPLAALSVRLDVGAKEEVDKVRSGEGGDWIILSLFGMATFEERLMKEKLLDGTLGEGVDA
jgi:hypothetical protein